MLSSAIQSSIVAVMMALLVAWTPQTRAQESFDLVKPLPDTNATVLGDTPTVIRSLLSLTPRVEAESPEATSVRPRGPATDLYPKVAPAVVLVTTPSGHGTGFFISKDGWILTNAHVVDGSNYSTQDKGNVVSIMVGVPGTDGWMEPSQATLKATIYRVSQRQDLALLKLQTLPPNLTPVPYLKLSSKSPLPGSQCVAIGHPGIGSLWSVREGQVTGSGQFPADQAGLIASLMGLTKEERKSLEMELAADNRQKKVFQSNCGISSGDSGGPLVNESGELVAVTFAIRSAESSGQLSLHIHLDEVREFIKDLPTAPDLIIPDAFPTGAYEAKPIDTNGDGSPEAVLLVSTASQMPVGLQIQLSTAPDVTGRNKINKMSATRMPDWQPNFSMYFQPTLTVLYDSNGDGEFNLIFRDTDGDGTVDTRYRKEQDDWTIAPTTEDPVSSSHFSKKELVNAFMPWMRDIGRLLNTGKGKRIP